VVEEMVRQLSMATRRELKDAIRERYQAATRRWERRQIVSEFVQVTGYHRKHAVQRCKLRTTGLLAPQNRQLMT
jgi:hypothetical protein